MNKVAYAVIVAFILSILMSVALAIEANTVKARVLSNFGNQSAENIMEKGREHYRAQRMDSAYLLFSVVARSYADSPDPRERELAVLALNNAGIVAEFYRLQYAEGYNLFSQALDIAEQEQMINAEAIVCVNMAELFMTYSRHQPTAIYTAKVNEFTERGFRKAALAGNHEAMAAILVNVLLYDLGTPTEVFASIFNDSIKESTRNVAFARRLINAGHLFKQGRYSETRTALKDALHYMNSQWNPEEYAVNVASSIGDTYRAEGKTDSAGRWYRRALHIADSLKETTLQLNTLYLLAQLPLPDASDYKMKYLEMKDSVMSFGHLSMVGELDFINNLRKEQKKSEELEQSRRTLLICISIGSAVLLVICVLAALLMRQTRHLTRSNRMLYQRINAQLELPVPPVATPADTENIVTSEPTDSKYSSSSLSQERGEEIFEAINKALSNEDILLSPELSLSRLSSSLGVNTTYVSRVINEKYGCSFSALVNDLRIKVACQRLNDVTNYGHVTIEAISHSVGFTSRGSFVAAFKRANGMTPSEYLKIARETHRKNQSSE